MSVKSVLLVDNDDDVLRSVGFNLMVSGYKVLKAKSVEQARKILSHEIFHLGIIDIRLEDEKRKADTSGFEVARELQGRVPCMVYTAYEDIYENKDNIHQVFGEIGAKEFLYKTKQDDPSKLIDVVNSLFKSNVKVNFDLEFEGDVSLQEIASQIRISPSDEDLQPSPDDVKQVLQTLFYDAEKIRLEPLLSPESGGSLSQSELALIQVHPFMMHSWAVPLIVKFGPRETIALEAENYRRLRPYIGGQQLAVLEGEAYSRQVGGLIYTLVGADTDLPMRTLRDVYLTEDIEDINNLLKQFFGQTFGPIFADAPREQIDLTTTYTEALDLTPTKLRLAAEKFRSELFEETSITFQGLNRTFRNPIQWALPDGNEFHHFSVYSHRCPYHGNLHCGNILLDANDHSWLIDFAKVGVGHAFHSFVGLEIDIRFNVLSLDNLEVLYYFERALLTPANFSDQPPQLVSNEDQLVRAYQVILALRRLASELVGPKVKVREYYQALFYHTLSVFCSSVDDRKKEHALLLAALIRQRLEDWPNWDVPQETTSPGKRHASNDSVANRTAIDDFKKKMSDLFKDLD